MTHSADLLIIGAGPGGYRAAQLAARRGLSVVVFESGHAGGTCLNEGCIPTKTYVHAATFAQARERQQTVVAQLRAGVEQLLSAPGITLVRSRAEFVDAHTLCTADGDDTYTAPHIIVATGSSPRMLALPDAATDPRVMDSTALLQLSEQPRSLCVIGAGVVGMELASAFHRFGTKVTVVEYLKECLPALDADVAKRLRKLMEKQGISFRMKTAVTQYADIEADAILVAVGRQPRVQPHFAKAGFQYDERQGIAVDAHFQTTVPGIYAIGDVNTRQMLAHAAEHQAQVVVDLITSCSLAEVSLTATEVSATATETSRSDAATSLTQPTPIPAAIFTHPEAACVGPTEEQLKATATPYEVRKAFHRANGLALAMDQGEGMVKLMSDPQAGRILACHAFGAGSAAIVQEASVLMALGATVGQLRHLVHIHPTLSELLPAAAEQ